MVVLRHTPAGCLLSVPLAELQIIIKTSCLSFFPASRQELLGTVHFDIATARNWQPRYFGAQAGAHTLVRARQSKEGGVMGVRGEWVHCKSLFLQFSEHTHHENV